MRADAPSRPADAAQRRAPVRRHRRRRLPDVVEPGPPRRYTWRPLTPERWGDLEAVFGASGAYGGCWCMSFRLPRAQWTAQRRAEGGAANRETLREMTERGDTPGILAYDGDAPVGWCGVAPRGDFPALDRSPLGKIRRDGDAPLWSIVCFYVPRAHRRRGVMSYLVRAAVEYVRERGGGVIEAYPRLVEGEAFAGS